MRIGEVTREDVLAGKRWRVLASSYEQGQQVLEWKLEPAKQFSDTDFVAYSGILVWEKGIKRPMLLVKEVGHADYGGEYVVLVDNRWVDFVDVPDTAGRIVGDFVAAPLDEDPSFGSTEGTYRTEHSQGFKQHSVIA